MRVRDEGIMGEVPETAWLALCRPFFFKGPPEGVEFSLSPSLTLPLDPAPPSAGEPLSTSLPPRASIGAVGEVRFPDFADLARQGWGEEARWDRRRSI